jgi:Zn-dependent membrane protease YugP
VRAVAQLDYVRNAIAPVTLTSLVIVLAFLVVGFVSESTILTIVGAFGLGSSTVFGLLSRRQRRRYRTSTAATRRVHGTDQPP